MNKLKLIHKPNEFLLEINNTEIKAITGYEIKVSGEKRNSLDLTLKISIDMSESSIDIENNDINNSVINEKFEMPILAKRKNGSYGVDKKD